MAIKVMLPQSANKLSPLIGMLVIVRDPLTISSILFMPKLKLSFTLFLPHADVTGNPSS